MRTILVPVDGSESSSRAVRAAIKAVNEFGGATLHLLTVHPPIVSGNVKRFFSVEAINDYYQDEGRNALLPAKAILDEAGIAYTEEIAVGPVAQTIADYAKKKECDMIIMGTRGLGAVAGFVLGSVTTKVLGLVDIPVALIK
ncbi:universal stress protein [Pollutimonas bauzanensis]|uniref:Nucleotide-binding universal stress protein, UspA family n=1 Tax=Pollutimonas bauzanensis TaxID=658167 RepID=A0A1M5W6Z6_9BURK|nr:universal stress protein [Pollutimonas bauzanensis]SHH83250.1 Nucleotide-binding universal stress protein, UspA family [Pollutimonas bauzanensis]